MTPWGVNIGPFLGTAAATWFVLCVVGWTGEQLAGSGFWHRVKKRWRSR